MKTYLGVLLAFSVMLQANEVKIEFENGRTKIPPIT